MDANQLTNVNPILPVTDMEASIKYYTEKLGFEVSFRDCTAPDHYVGVRRGDVELHLQLQRAEDMPKPGTLMIRFVVNDPLVIFEEFANRGVFDTPLNTRAKVEEQPWGTVEFSFCDLNGHGLIFYCDM